MNIKEAKDVLTHVNAEYLVYCDSGNNVDWFGLCSILKGLLINWQIINSRKEI